MEVLKIIITGGAARIGAAIAESLANHKNQITIHYNRSEEKAESTVAKSTHSDGWQLTSLSIKFQLLITSPPV